MTALTVSAGCVTTAEDVVTFTIYNGLGDETTIGVRIEHDESDTLVFDEEVTLAGETKQVYTNPMVDPGLYTIYVSVPEMYEERYEWTISENGAPNIYLEVDPNGMGLSDAPR
jgi:hypothetical protein